LNARIERSRRYLLLLLLMSAVALAPARSQVPEPQAYWLGPIHGPVPATITGGSVVGTAQLVHLLARGGVVLIDVAEAPHHPSGLPPGTLWLPPPHRDIPGSIWIPDVGRGAISPQFADWYQARLAELTGGKRDTPVVVYCHPNCWMSWNAAKRAINDGYRSVFWYPDGVEGWQKAGHATAIAHALGLDAPR
jgi:PQQ-dependent catabolism-associated CXXCW motif protein